MDWLERASQDRPPLAADQDGVVRVRGTRVTLDTVVGAFEDGDSAEEIAQNYPTVSLADVYSAIGFYLHHRDAVEAYLDGRREFAEAVRRENEARFPPNALRARLLA